MTDESKGLKRWKFSTNVIPCMKESDDGAYWSCNDVKSILRGLWKRYKVDITENERRDIVQELEIQVIMLEEIYLGFTGEELK